ncbi:spermidine/putrescine ABC transporter substrate-binding protein PotF [Paramagnetospirillum kuznetsovii]|uniref:Putrescine-binding periplasmic protein n=1 Tax=Paramagnetospirillum kuznetsovii TaxID=2053833 RepID=A0A364NVR7_9PROT|nr:polyamine ABC transporter substrate-binding protein [Paramagnetospirillum kuznetsovii]RAU21184.1 spermidine/putrescine ABC transporter substrate-binding protein PotF [Paramagnetospirillum kuznetsovii]
MRIAVIMGLVLLSTSAWAEEEKVVNVYNWSDYVAPDTLEKFTKATGIKVNYDVYDGNEILSAKLQAGKSGYDVVFPSASPFLASQIKAGIYQKLDRAKLKNYAGLDPQVMKTMASVADPGNLYAVPYQISATGIGYNMDKVAKAAPGMAMDSWSVLFDPAQVAKLKGCGVSVLDTPTEVFPAALLHLGKTGSSLETADLKAAAAAVTAIRPSLKYFHSSKYINDIANGDTCMAHGYVGDLVQARNRANEAGKGVKIGIFIPKEGAVVNIDAAAIPKDAPHPDNAHAFIDFLLKPDIMGDITNTTGYANAVAASKSVVKKEILADPVIYPPADVLAKEFQVPPADLAKERERTRIWTSVKTGK